MLGLLLAAPLVCQAQSTGSSPVAVPAGTTVDPISYDGAAGGSVQLPPAEQVALLFAYGIWGLENDCADADSGLGRLCTLDELIKGVTGKNGGTIGLTVSPRRDTNYRYEVMLVGDYSIILAHPRVKGLGGFAVVGSPNGFGGGNFYYNPNGANMAEAKKLTSVGYGGKGFRR